MRPVGGNVVGYVGEVLAVDAVVGGEPCAWSLGKGKRHVSYLWTVSIDVVCGV